LMLPGFYTELFSALSDDKYVKMAPLPAVRLNRLPSNAIPSGKKNYCSRCL
jgi:hypothetical protein